MKRNFLRVFLFLLILINFRVFASGNINSSEFKDSYKKVDILIELKESFSLKSGVASLKDDTLKSQKNILTFLDGEKAKGKVDLVETFYITNAIHTICTDDLIKELQAFDEIKKISFNEDNQLLTFDPSPIDEKQLVNNPIMENKSNDFYLEMISADKIEEKFSLTGEE